MAPPRPRPVLSGASADASFTRIGLLSDVQWSPHAEVGKSFHGTKRFYVDALQKAKRAVESFERHNCDLVIHLGDIVDYHAGLHERTEEAFERILDETLHTLDVPGTCAVAKTLPSPSPPTSLSHARIALDHTPVLHCIGNHCLYNLEREKLNARLGIRSRDDHRSYFVHRMDDRKLAIAVLDAYDVSILGTREGEPQRTLAEKLLNDNNPNEEKNSNAGLEGLQRRFVKFGGGVSEKQLSWLERELAESRDRGEKVIVASHVCFHPETCAPTCLMWNFEEVLQVLQRNADVVVMTLAGHAHRGGYFKDEHGIHHRVAEAILECPIGSDCHAHLDFYDDGRIDIEGFGEFASQRLQFIAGAS